MKIELGVIMRNIGRLLIKGIYQNAWIKIEYRNKEKEITKYMIGINDIDPLKKLFNVIALILFILIIQIKGLFILNQF